MGVRYQRAVDLVELTGILQTTVTGFSIDEIANRFEVSRRTAERMLSALRDRFPDLEPVFRSGRKYWKLPSTSRTSPLQLPRTVEALNERIAQLEAEVSESRSSAETARGITDDVFGTSPVGMIVVNSSFEVVWANDSLGRYLGQDVQAWIGSDMRSLIREGLVPAMREDLVLLRSFMRVFNLLEAPADLMKDPQIMQRALAAYERRGEREAVVRGPNREDMLETLSAVA